jgi:MFS superfamily sulfate permease-like transporter/CRP-like cAMP-binding protein
MLSPSHRSTPKLSSIRTDYSKPTTVNSPSLISPLLSKVGSKTEISNNESKQQPVLVLAIIYGLINTILTVPCMYGYALIIFSDPFFSDYTPSLCKLVLLSSAVHQIMFSIQSSLPFAIGQVQDAGLLFLHSIATSIVKAGQEQKWSNEDILATVLVTLSLSTSLLGVALMIIGKLKLASLVSYLPAPVVGGYLAFIGYFCLLSGINLCTGVIFNASISDGPSFLQLFQSPKLLVLSIPGIIGGVILLFVSTRSKKVASLPIAIVSLPGIFYITMLIFQFTFNDVRNGGWIDYPSTNTTSFVKVFDMFSLSNVHWSAMPSQFLTWLSMTFVVSFSSCLDVAAIEMDIGKQLKINHELKTVGLSNVISGLLGGYTGSYIFSQTIFTSRTNVHSRIVGVVVIVSEIALFLLPISIMSYVPKFFFAATLIFIAIDLLTEWLYLMYYKLLFREYMLVIITLGLIVSFGLQFGMVLSIVVAGIGFVWSYSRTSKRSVTRVVRQSNVLAPADDRLRMQQAHREIVTLTIHGYVFFGSAKRIVNDVFKNVHVQTVEVEDSTSSSGRNVKINTEQEEIDELTHSLNSSLESKTPGQSSSSISWTPNLVGRQIQQKGKMSATGKSGERLFSVGKVRTLLSCVEKAQGGGSTTGDADNQLDDQEDPILPTRILILDFERCHGMDATAVKSCFSVLDQLCSKYGVTVVCCGASKEIKFLLNANDLSQWNPGKHDDIDGALAWAEELVQNESAFVNLPVFMGSQHGRKLARIGTQRRAHKNENNENDEDISIHRKLPIANRKFSMEAAHKGMVAAHLLRMAKCEEAVTEDEAKLLVDAEYFFDISSEKLSLGNTLFRAGEPSDTFYILKEGGIKIVSAINDKSDDLGVKNQKKKKRSIKKRDLTVKVGFIFGESTFILSSPREENAVVTVNNTEVWSLNRLSLLEMEKERPDVYQVFQKILLRVLAHQLNWAKDF